MTRLPTILEPHEVRAILKLPSREAPTGVRNLAMLAAMHRCGLRVSEVTGLRPEHIRWSAPLLEVHDGKGGKDRNLPVDGITVERFKDWPVPRSELLRRVEARRRPAPATQRKGNAASQSSTGKGKSQNGTGASQSSNGETFFTTLRGCPDRERFFTTLKGARVSIRYVQRLVKRLAVKALGPVRGRQVTPHTLRHTYATELVDEGFTLREVQTLLGHSSVATTQIYTHVRPHRIAEKIRLRESALGSLEAEK